jgi:putative transposase
MKDLPAKMMTPAARREAAAYLQGAFSMSERQACRVIGVDRSGVRYQAGRPDDGVLRERLKALAQERRRFGDRRVHVLLRRQGHAINKTRVQRLYREEKLTVRRRGGRKRAVGTRAPIAVPLRPNERWSLELASPPFGSFRTRRPTAAASASWPWSTTVRARAWHWCSTPPRRSRCTDRDAFQRLRRSTLPIGMSGRRRR